jgi:hypothetical protein
VGRFTRLLAILQSVKGPRETARVLGCVALLSPRRGRHSGSHGRQPVGKGLREFELSPRRVATLLAEMGGRVSLQTNSSENTCLPAVLLVLWQAGANL